MSDDECSCCSDDAEYFCSYEDCTSQSCGDCFDDFMAECIECGDDMCMSCGTVDDDDDWICHDCIDDDDDDDDDDEPQSNYHSRPPRKPFEFNHNPDNESMEDLFKGSG